MPKKSDFSQVAMSLLARVRSLLAWTREESRGVRTNEGGGRRLFDADEILFTLGGEGGDKNIKNRYKTQAQQLARNAQAFAEQARHFEWIDEDPSLTLEMVCFFFTLFENNSLSYLWWQARGDSDNVVLDSIKHRCDVLWAELVDVQVQIDAQCGQEQGQQPVVSEQKQLLDVMETRLASELESLRLGSSYKPHKQETIIQLEMEQQLQRSIAELAQTQSVLQTDTHSARAEVTRLTAQRAELSDEQAKLQVHLDEGRLADSEASTKYGASFTVSINTRSRQSAERELNQKIRQSAEQNSALLKQMVAFIDKYFPIVTVPVSSGATGQVCNFIFNFFFPT